MSDYAGKWLRSPRLLRFHVADAVATITLDRPDKRNALSFGLLEELRSAVMEADDRTDVSAILLQGAGRDFCAGYDINDRYAGHTADAAADGGRDIPYRSHAARFDDDVWQLRRMQEAVLTVYRAHKPVIAKVQGNCLAGGTDLAFSCDLILAATNARFGFPAARALGTPPTHWWLYHGGPQLAKRLLFTGDVIEGDQAARSGLILDAVPPDDLDNEAAALARRVALVDDDMLAAHKRVVNAGLELMGAMSLQAISVEENARSHQGQGPARRRFLEAWRSGSLKDALAARDAPFGDGVFRRRVHGGAP